jgi:RHS repeat-associated protein
MTQQQDGPTQNYIWGNGLLESNGTEEFRYLTDHLGSPIRLIGTWDNPNDIPLAYDEFGVPLVDTACKSEGNPFGFTGYQAEDISGLYYAQARFYESGTGRFISQDPYPGNIVQSASLNRFTYCLNNPLIYFDPSGYVTKEEGVAAHQQIQALFKIMNPKGETDFTLYINDDEKLRPDIFHTYEDDFGVEQTDVYEIKTIRNSNEDTALNRKAKNQLEEYIYALKYLDYPNPRPGTEFNPNGFVMPFVNDPTGRADRYIVLYTHYDRDPGMIYYDIINEPIREPSIVPDPQYQLAWDKLEKELRDRKAQKTSGIDWGKVGEAVLAFVITAAIVLVIAVAAVALVVGVIALIKAGLIALVATGLVTAALVFFGLFFNCSGSDTAIA